MTQVPEYLLERSRARRAALGLGGDAPAPSGDGGGAPAPAAPAGDGGGGGGGTAVATAPAPARAAPAAPPAPAAPLPDYVRDPGPKSGIPYWIMPILIILPLWAILYMGAFGDRVLPNAAPTPQQLYASNCASCHGARGEGGVGPQLAGGEAKATFPNEEDHIKWVQEGSSTKRGQPYGDPARAGGQRTATSGGMPGFAGRLSEAEIKEIVAYERNNL